MEAKKERPNVVGKGPALTREMIAIFEEIQEISSSIPSNTLSEIRSGVGDRAQALQKVIKMAYLKTVKAGEMAWDLRERAIELKSAIANGDESRASKIYKTLIEEVDEFVKKIKSFVVRMT